MPPTAVSEVPATEDLWASLVDDLRRFVRRRVGDEASAEDIVQDVFLRVHEHRGELRDSDRIGGWVFGIARNAVIDDQRRRGRLVEEVEVAQEDAGFEEPTAGQALGSWLRGMIRTLDPIYREALTLTEIEGLDQKRAAERLGLSHSGFKSRVQRGRAQLRRALFRCCEVQFDRIGGVVEYRARAHGNQCCD